MARAEAAMREAMRVCDFARKAIGEANVTHTQAVLVGTHVVVPAKPFSKERVRKRKSAAFRLFNQRRGELSRARRRVDVARVALGQPTLAVVEQRQAIAAEVRASKRRTIRPTTSAEVAAA